MKKVLIVSYSFPPDNAPAAQRPYFMALYLIKMGYNVHVLTADNSDSSLGKSNWANLSGINIIRVNPLIYKKEKKNVEKITVKNSDTKINNQGKLSLFARKIIKGLLSELLIPDKAAPWFYKALRRAKYLCRTEHYNIIYSSSPSMVNHLICSRIKKRFNLRWIADIRDYYFIHSRENERFLFRKYFDRKIENLVMNKSDVLSFISGSMKKEYTDRYPFIDDKAHIIFNGFDQSEFPMNSYNEITSKKMSVFYAGSFYEGTRSPYPLLIALDYLIKQGELCTDDFDIEIAGNLPDNIISGMKLYKSSASVKYLGKISRGQALDKMRKSHLLWLIIGDQIAHYSGFPVKGFEYIGARRPILVFTPNGSEPHRIISELNCGVRLSGTVDSHSIEKNVGILRNYFKLLRDGKLSNPVIIDEIILKKYTRQYQAEQLSKLF